MDVLRALILVYHAKVERERFRIALLRQYGDVPMPGEIRAARERFNARHTKMIDSIVTAMDAVTADVASVETEGLNAVKLVAATKEAARQEIREITADLASQTNGPPPGPLPDTASPASSATSSTPSSVEQQPQAPQQADKPWRPASDDHLKPPSET